MAGGNRPRRDDRLLRRILRGTSDTNIRFSELRRLLARLGFEERISGGHRIFSRDGILERINLQPRRGQVKSYRLAGWLHNRCSNNIRLLCRGNE